MSLLFVKHGLYRPTPLILAITSFATGCLLYWGWTSHFLYYIPAAACGYLALACLAAITADPRRTAVPLLQAVVYMQAGLILMLLLSFPNAVVSGVACQLAFVTLLSLSRSIALNDMPG